MTEYTTFDDGNLGGIACDSITLIALEDIFSESNTEVVCTEATQIYFTEDTAQHTEAQKTTVQGELFEQRITFSVPKNRAEIRDWLTSNHRKYFYVQYIDKNGYAIEVPITQLNSKYSTGRQGRDKNGFDFVLEGTTIKPAKEARGITENLGIPYLTANELWFDGLNDNVILDNLFLQILQNYIQYNKEFTISIWLNINNSYSQPNGQGNVLFGINNAIYDGTSTKGLNVGSYGANNFNFFIVNLNNTGSIGESYNLPANAGLHNFTFVHKANQNLKVYFDGVLKYTTPTTLNTLVNYLSGITPAIGYYSSGTFFQKGNLAHIHIFDKEFTQFEVTLLKDKIIPQNAIDKLVFSMPFESIQKVGDVVSTSDTVSSLKGTLSGYATGAKGIVDSDGNDIQLVP